MYFRSTKCEKISAGINGITKWIDEIVWREFYRNIMHSFPRVSKNRPFNLGTEGIEWRNNNDDLKAWKTGMTGYPIVDAGMRQLNETGYMHNRLRMVTAGFLCKHLLIDWRWGEKYFAKFN